MGLAEDYCERQEETWDFLSTDSMTRPCRQMFVAMRAVFLAEEEIVCSTFEVLPSLVFRLKVLAI
jgi:hypothetical protein